MEPRPGTSKQHIWKWKPSKASSGVAHTQPVAPHQVTMVPAPNQRSSHQFATGPVPTSGAFRNVGVTPVQPPKTFQQNLPVPTDSASPSYQQPIQFPPPQRFQAAQQNISPALLINYGVDLSDRSTQELILNAAQREYFNKNYELAEHHCLQLCKQQPNYTSTGPLLLLACIYFQSNRLELSEYFCKSALHLNPNLAEAYSNLGNVYRSKGQLFIAIDQYRQAISLKPDLLDAYINLATSYLEAGDKKQAETTYQTVLDVNPDLYNVLNDLGKLYMDMGRTDKAQEYYVKAILKKPDFATAWNNMGCVFSNAGDIWKAIHHFEKAILYDPNFFEAYVNAGNVCKIARIFTRAEMHYTRALSLKPNHPSTLLHFACLQQEVGRWDWAIQLFEKVIQLGSHLYHAFIGLGKCWQRKGFTTKAEELFHMALRFPAPESADFYYRLGKLKHENGLIEEARNLYLCAVKLSPSYLAAHWKLGEIYRDGGYLREAMLEYGIALQLSSGLADSPLATAKAALIPNDSFCNLLYCRQVLSDWIDFYAAAQSTVVNIVGRQLMEGDIRIPSVHPHNTFMFPGFSSEQRKEIASRHVAAIEGRLQKLDGKPFTHDKYPIKTAGSKDCLKIGYFTGDTRTALLVQSLAGYHSQEKVKVFCYTLCPLENGISSRSDGEYMVHVNLSEIACPLEAAKLIYEAGINILVNMTCYGRGARNEILAMKPAPVQVTWMGGPGGTSGAPYMDYIITDITSSPALFKTHFSEKLMHMPHTSYFGDHKQRFRDIQEQPTCTRKQYGLPEDAVIFCSFNQWYKLEPDTLILWLNILVSVPNSVLWLLRHQLNGNRGEESIMAIAALFGDVGKRIIFADVIPREEHLQRSQLADVFLDTPLCNGRYTSMDMLWAGVPVVTMCSAEIMGSRVTASLLNSLGMTELVATTKNEFWEIGKKLGNDDKYRKIIRGKIWKARLEGRLFDGEAFAKDLEQLYEKMWEAYHCLEEKGINHHITKGAV